MGLALLPRSRDSVSVSVVAVSVLIVDDDAGFRQTAAELLRSRGFDVAGEAADRSQALAALGRLQPDAILLDIHLPDVDGLDFLRQLTAIPSVPPILLTSSDPDAATHEVARQCGAIGFVSKTELADADLARYLGC
jgi:CheY-like chemotaxis protein